MRIEYVLYGPLADAVAAGDEEVCLERDAMVETSGGAVRTLTDEFPALEPLVLDSAGRLRAHVSLRQNGDPLPADAAFETSVEAGDTLALEPGVKGGC